MEDHRECPKSIFEKGNFRIGKNNSGGKSASLFKNALGIFDVTCINLAFITFIINLILLQIFCYKNQINPKKLKYSNEYVYIFYASEDNLKCFFN